MVKIIKKNSQTRLCNFLQNADKNFVVKFIKIYKKIATSSSLGFSSTQKFFNANNCMEKLPVNDEIVATFCYFFESISSTIDLIVLNPIASSSGI